MNKQRESYTIRGTPVVGVDELSEKRDPESCPRTWIIRKVFINILFSSIRALVHTHGSVARVHSSRSDLQSHPGLRMEWRIADPESEK